MTVLTNLQLISRKENATIVSKSGYASQPKAVLQEVWKGQVRVPLSSLCKGDMDTVFSFKLETTLVCKEYLRTKMPKVKSLLAFLL